MPKHLSHVEFNPYRAPESAGFPSQSREAGTTGRHLSPLKAGVVSWGLTVIAGGMFGFGIFGFIGAAFGLILAGAAAVPAAAVIFIALKIIFPAGVSRNTAVISAALCGCVTGFGSTVGFFGNNSLPFAAVAGLVGAMVPAIGVGLMRFSNDSYREPEVPAAVWADLETQLHNVTGDNEGSRA